MNEIDKTKLNELSKVLAEKYAAFYDLEARKRARKQQLDREVYIKLDEEFGAETKAIQVAKGDAQRLHDEEQNRIRILEAQDSLPYPVGTKVVEWSRDRWGFGEKKLTGEAGVMEIFKAGDLVAGNKKFLPAVGSIIVRLFKKDGSTGAKFKVWSNWMKDCWLPEGVEPIDKKAR